MRNKNKLTIKERKERNKNEKLGKIWKEIKKREAS